MKKCSRCQVLFHDDERLRCLYCDTTLWRVDEEEEAESGGDILTPGFQSSTPLIEQILKSRGLAELGRMQLVVGNYFRMRTFQFMYNFCRNEYKRGQAYSRLLVQPLNITSFLTIPWVLWDILDTMIFRFTYNGFCEKCQSKYRKVTQGQDHDPDDCTYCREYFTLVEDILTGRITKTEPQYKQLGLQKVKMGKRSAYHDLCVKRTHFVGLMDILCIWTSIFVLISLVIWLLFPYITVLMHSLVEPGREY